MIIRNAIISCCLCAALPLCAQESRTAYSYLRLPQSAHVSSLGGDNVSMITDDALLAHQNPALLYNVPGRTLSLGYMRYMEGVQVGSAMFSNSWGERASWAVSGQYMSYGTLTQTTADWQQTGTFTAKDVAVGATMAYAMTNRLTGGVTMRMLSSHIGQYDAIAAVIDVGLNYYDSEHDISISAVMRSLGGQLEAYNDDFERMPTDLQVGVTKRLTGAPLRFHVTAVRLNDWEIHGLGNHLVVGADILLGSQMYLSAGYNALRAKEMQIDSGEEGGSSSHGAAMSFGGGLTLDRMHIEVSYAKYHVSSPTLLFNFSLKI